MSPDYQLRQSFEPWALALAQKLEADAHVYSAKSNLGVTRRELSLRLKAIGNIFPEHAWFREHAERLVLEGRELKRSDFDATVLACQSLLSSNKENIPAPDWEEEHSITMLRL